MNRLQTTWPLSAGEAVRLQHCLAGRIIRQSTLKSAHTVAGVDTAYQNRTARAAVVVLRCPEFEVVAEAVVQKEVRFPYLPGLLAFREGPAVMDCLQRLKERPDLVLFDAHGFAHPRRLGLASHIGVLLDTPTIGCAKTRLIGEYSEPAALRGSYTFLREGPEVIGAVVRTRSRVAPLFVSIGHRINLADSIRYVIDGCRGFRIPEVLRRADHLARFPRPITEKTRCP